MNANSKPVMLRLISSAVSIATRAGAKVREITKIGVLDVIDKGVQDYQTKADRVVQRMIVSSLSKKYPSALIVGEEDLPADPEADAKYLIDTYDNQVLQLSLPDKYQNLKEEDITIWVDPLDGTTDFVKGFYEHVTILIGISVNGQTVAGVINQPFYGYNGNGTPENLEGRTMWSLSGLGCFGIVPKNITNEKLILTTTASHGNSNIDDSIASLKPDEVIRVGGAGYKVLLIIEGKAHSYVFPSNGCKRWDTSAPEALLEAAGGKLTTVFGQKIQYNYKDDAKYQNTLGVIASMDSIIHSKVIDGVPERVKEQLREADAKIRAKY